MHRIASNVDSGVAASDLKPVRLFSEGYCSLVNPLERQAEGDLEGKGASCGVLA